MIYIVDWLSFTTKFYNYEQIIDFLGLPVVNWVEKSGHNGYRACLLYENIRINFNDKDTGCFVNMSGTGCRAFESLSSLEWSLLFKKLIDGGEQFNITRLDIACDEKEGILPLKRISDITDKFIKGETENVCTKFSWAKIENSTQGLSIYYGSPKSDFRIRIYDKAAERGFTDIHWVRVELQIRRDMARNMIVTILEIEDIGKCFCGVVNNYLRFVKRSHTRSENCSNLQWWERFIDSADKIRIFKRVGQEYNLYKVESYLDNQVGNTLQTYIRCHGGDIDFLLDLILKERKLSKKQLDLINYHERGMKFSKESLC